MTDPQDAKARSQAQFGANAASYATSAVHAKGESLQRLVDLVAPKAHWRMLDIATAAGHTAFAFAPHVGSVVASDLTPEMVALAHQRAAELGHDNVVARRADAELLPFDHDSFDLVTCRIAPHHFPQPARFIDEVARVLRSAGVFGFVDNVVSEDEQLAAIYNEWERDRDPSHVRALSQKEWLDLFEAAGFTIRASEITPKRLTFTDWVDNMNVPEDRRPDLFARLFDPYGGLCDFLNPLGTNPDDASFALLEGLIVAVAA